MHIYSIVWLCSCPLLVSLLRDILKTDITQEFLCNIGAYAEGSFCANIL